MNTSEKNSKNEINLLIATPAYNCMIHMDYVKSLIEFLNSGIKFSFMPLGNESLITRARNTLISFFYHNKQFTHLLFLDADIYLSGQGLASLLLKQKDVIGAPVPLKGKDVLGNNIFNVGKQLSEPDENNLIEVDRIGTAVLLFSRNAAEKLCESSEKYTRNKLTRGLNIETPDFDVFKTGVFDNEYYSEDYYACRKLRELGFNVYVDVSVKTIHYGNFSF